MKIIKDRFSMPFVNLLCESLRLSHSKRARLNDLLEHSFLKSQSKDSRTVNLSLKDLLLIRAADQEAFIESVILPLCRVNLRDWINSSVMYYRF